MTIQLAGSKPPPTKDQPSFLQTAPLLVLEHIHSYLNDPHKAAFGRTCTWAQQAHVQCKLTAIAEFFAHPVVKKLYQTCSETPPSLSNQHIIKEMYQNTHKARALVPMLQFSQLTEECLRDESREDLLPLPVYFQSLAIGRSADAKRISQKSLDKILKIASQLRYNDWCVLSAASSLGQFRQWSKKFPWREISPEIFDEQTKKWLSLVDTLSEEEWDVITQTAKVSLKTHMPQWKEGEFDAKEIFSQLKESPLQASVFFTQFEEEPLQIDMTDKEDLNAFMEFSGTSCGKRLGNLHNLGFFCPMLREYRTALEQGAPLRPQLAECDLILADINRLLDPQDSTDPRYASLFKLREPLIALRNFAT